MGVPSMMLPLVIALEVLGGIAIVLGFKARLVAFVMAGFSVASAILFHADFADQTQMMMFMKNIAMAGGFLIRVPMPPMSEERRKEMTKIVRSEGENAKIAIRNLRRDANEAVKKLVKDKEATEDDQKRTEADVQKVTDKHIAEIDALVASKEKDIMEV